MKKAFWVFPVLLMMGCTTLQLSKGVDMNELREYPEGVRLGLVSAKDLRGSNSIGSIGAAGYKLKGEVVDFTTNQVMSSANHYLQANLLPISQPAESEMAGVALRNNLDGFVIPEIHKIKLFSMDSLMQPVETDVDIKVNLYNAKGEAVYNSSYAGHYEKRVGLVTSPKPIAELVENAIKDAVSKFVKDEEMKKQLQSFKTVQN